MAVPRREDEIAEGERVDALLGELGDTLEVAGGLGHLPAGHQQMLPVDPDAGRRAADQRRRLGDLVLVVREDVVDPAGMQVEPIAQVAAGHRRALEVPARKTVAPAVGRPFQRSARAGSLPQGEIGRIALVGLDLAAMPGPEVLERIPGELPVAGKGADGVIDIVGVRRIGHTAVLERLGQLDHLGDVLGGAREHVAGRMLTSASSAWNAAS